MPSRSRRRGCRWGLPAGSRLSGTGPAASALQPPPPPRKGERPDHLQEPAPAAPGPSPRLPCGGPRLFFRPVLSGCAGPGPGVSQPEPAVWPEGLKCEAGGGPSATPASASKRLRATGRGAGVMRSPIPFGQVRPAPAPRPASGASPRIGQMGLPGQARHPLALRIAAPSGSSATPAPAGTPRTERNPAAGGASHPAGGERQGWPMEAVRRPGEAAPSPRARRTGGNVCGQTGWGWSRRSKH